MQKVLEKQFDSGLGVKTLRLTRSIWRETLVSIIYFCLEEKVVYMKKCIWLDYMIFVYLFICMWYHKQNSLFDVFENK